TPLTVTAALSSTPPSGYAATTASLSGHGFGPGESVSVWWACSTPPCGTSPLLGTATTDATGSFSGLSVTIPTTATVGTRYLGALGASSGASAATTYIVRSGTQAGASVALTPATGA